MRFSGGVEREVDGEDWDGQVWESNGDCRRCGYVGG